MLRVNSLVGFNSSYQPPMILTLADFGGSGSDTNSYTFSGATFGAEAAGRYLIFVAQMNAGNPSGVSPVVTIDGTPATIIARDFEGTAAFGVFGMLKPTGTTGTIVLNGDSGWDRCSIATYQAFNVQSLTAYDTLKVPENLTTSLSGDINVPLGGAIVAISYFGGTSNATWTGVAESWEGSNERDSGGAAEVFTTSSGTKTISVTDASLNPQWLYAVSFR